MTLALRDKAAPSGLSALFQWKSEPFVHSARIDLHHTGIAHHGELAIGGEAEKIFQFVVADGQSVEFADQSQFPSGIVKRYIPGCLPKLHGACK